MIVTASAQITITKHAPKVEHAGDRGYDSTINFLGKDVYKYIGQELYLKEKKVILRQFGYDAFLIDYTKSKYESSNVYKCCDNYNSKYNELAGKYFRVLDVIKYAKADEGDLYGSLYKFYLKLEEKETKDIVYFKYDVSDDFSFHFIVVGYFEKLKQTAIGKEYIVRGRNWISTGEIMTDMKSGTPVSNFNAGGKWKCIDVSVEDRYYELCLILENDKGEQIPLGVDYAKDTYWVFESGLAELYRDKFGDEDWQRILDGKIWIGMTQEMCQLSWNKPEKTNEIITFDKISEEWIYPESILYFENGILILIR